MSAEALHESSSPAGRQIEAGDSMQSTRRSAIGTWVVVAGIVAASAAANIWYVTHAPLDLSADETHYWEWSQRLDWSYYSKGPLVACIIALGRLFFSGMDADPVFVETLAIRVPAVLLSALTSLGMFLLSRRVFQSDRVAIVTLMLTLTVPILGIGSIFMTTDVPMVCLWTWALLLFAHAVERNSFIAWTFGGILVALGILAKYTMVLIFPSVGLVLLLDRVGRQRLGTPGPYTGLAVGLLGFVPVLIWNMDHGWMSFRHVAGQTGVTGGGYNPLGPVEMILGQAVAFNPVWFAMMYFVFGEVRRAWSPRTTESGRADLEATFPAPPVQSTGRNLLVAATLVVACVYILFSFVTKIQPNWPVPALVPATCLLVDWLVRAFVAGSLRIRRRLAGVSAAAAVFGVVLIIVSRDTTPLMPIFAWLARNEPPWQLTPVAKYDPASRLRGWSQLGSEVAALLEAERADGNDPMILTDHYQSASAIAFYARRDPSFPPEVYCIQSAVGGRLNQYDVWMNPITSPEQFYGRRSLYVGSMRHEAIFPKEGTGALGRTEFVRAVEHVVGEHPVRISPVVRGLRFEGFDASNQSQLIRKY